MNWTIEDILKLYEYQYLKKALYKVPNYMEEDAIEEITRLVQLEAELILMNKDVVGYINSEPSDIYSFKEALEMESKCDRQGKEFTFHELSGTIHDNHYSESS